MSTEGANRENLLERIIQMNMIIIEEMQEQRKQMYDQKTIISSGCLYNRHQQQLQH